MSEEEEQVETTKLRKSDVILDARLGIPDCYAEFFSGKPKSSEAPKEGDEAQEGAQNTAPVDKKSKSQATAEKPNVIVTVKQRTKRKNVTSIENLEPWGIDIKDFSKHIAKKLAIGCSTQTFPATGLGIIIQGDVGEQIIHSISNQFGVPIKSITAIRKVKKAPEPKQPAAQPQFDLNGSSDDDDSDSDEEPNDGDAENHEEEEDFENPNQQSKKQKKKQQQQNQHEKKGDDNQANEADNNEEFHGGNRGRGRGGNRGGHRGGRGGKGGRGGHPRGRGKH